MNQSLIMIEDNPYVSNLIMKKYKIVLSNFIESLQNFKQNGNIQVFNKENLISI